MTKGYWIARVDVENPDDYPDYIKTARPAFERFGAKFLTRGGKTEVLEGSARQRNVVIEFASVKDAMDCYHSPEYQAAAKIRQNCAVADLIIIEGVE